MRKMYTINKCTTEYDDEKEIFYNIFHVIHDEIRGVFKTKEEAMDVFKTKESSFFYDEYTHKYKYVFYTVEEYTTKNEEELDFDEYDYHDLVCKSSMSYDEFDILEVVDDIILEHNLLLIKDDFKYWETILLEKSPDSIDNMLSSKTPQEWEQNKKELCTYLKDYISQLDE